MREKAFDMTNTPSQEAGSLLQPALAEEEGEPEP